MPKKNKRKSKDKGKDEEEQQEESESEREFYAMNRENDLLSGGADNEDVDDNKKSPTLSEAY